MNAFMDRRCFLRFAAGAAALASALSSGVRAYESKWPKKPAVPTDFNAEEFFCELEEKGHGVHLPKVENAPVAFMVFDTQCQWCVWEEEQYKPFFEKVNFVWHPVAVLSPWSELQGAAILASKDPVKTFFEHAAHFRDEAFKGLDVRNMEIPFESRVAVWDNSKIFRRSGCRDVPFGVMKTLDGRYIPLPEQTTADFAKLTGIKL